MPLSKIYQKFGQTITWPKFQEFGAHSKNSKLCSWLNLIPQTKLDRTPLINHIPTWQQLFHICDSPKTLRNMPTSTTNITLDTTLWSSLKGASLKLHSNASLTPFRKWGILHQFFTGQSLINASNRATIIIHYNMTNIHAR